MDNQKVMDNKKKDILKKSLRFKNIPKGDLKNKTSNVEKAVKDSTSPSRFPNVAGKVMKSAATVMFPGAMGLSKSVDTIKDIAKSDKMKTLKSKIKNISLNPFKAYKKDLELESKKQDGYKQDAINNLINDGMDPEDAYNKVNNIG